MEEYENKEFRKKIMELRLLWGAMLGSLAVYVIVANMIPENALVHVGRDFPIDLFRNILIGISSIELGTVYFIRPRVMSFIKKRSVKSGKDYVYQGYMVATLVFLAVSESVGIYGLVLFLLGDNNITLGFFIFLSVAGMFLFRPQKEELWEMTNSSSGKKQ